MKLFFVALLFAVLCVLPAVLGYPLRAGLRKKHAHRHRFRGARHTASVRSLGRRLHALTTMVRAIESDEEEEGEEEEGEEGEEEGGEGGEEGAAEGGHNSNMAVIQRAVPVLRAANVGAASAAGAPSRSGGYADESDLAETDNADLDNVHEPAAEPTVKLTSAASKVPTEIREVPMTGGEFRGIPGGIVDNTNITHLSYMIFKLIKRHEITSVIDMPCRNTLHWFPGLLHRLDFEIVGFKYYCVDSEANSQDDIRHLFGDAGQPEFMHIKPEEAAQLPKADLLFSWNGPQEWGVRQTWAFLNGVREVRPEYLLITNNPGVSNANANQGAINVRKQPFHFAQAQRVISNMEVPPQPPKQLLLYEMDGIRRGF